MSARRSIPAVARRFGTDQTPIIRAGFRPGTGWDRAREPHAVSRSRVKSISQSGYTVLRLALNGEQLDFTIDELLG